jgi:hypothetical protein
MLEAGLSRQGETTFQGDGDKKNSLQKETCHLIVSPLRIKEMLEQGNSTQILLFPDARHLERTFDEECVHATDLATGGLLKPRNAEVARGGAPPLSRSKISQRCEERKECESLTSTLAKVWQALDEISAAPQVKESHNTSRARAGDTTFMGSIWAANEESRKPRI